MCLEFYNAMRNMTRKEVVDLMQLEVDATVKKWAE